ncbi:MAPEG family protein [soil metagenome]
MTAAPELLLIGAAVLVGLVQLLWAAGAARGQQDLKWAAGPRDEPMPLTGIAARLDRAFKNYMETFPFFVAAVFAAYLVAKTGPLTLWGSVLYVAARALYVPLYAAGIPRIRSLVWLVSLVGVGMIVAAIFLA